VPVVLAGGVFANVRVNQKIRELPGVTDVYIQPAMGDQGLSLGAALLAFAETHKDAETLLSEDIRPCRMDNVYLGPEYSSWEILSACESANADVQQVPNIEKRIAEWIHQGFVVGYYRGRMEFGPRALGHRSILARPTDRSINDALNKRLRRTEFMPFAPSILAEHAGEYFEDYQPGQAASEYMTITYNVRKEYRQQIQAVVHVDETARPQVVHHEKEPFYYRVISEYYNLSGIPAIINTSFNVHEEPIVCTPYDALRSFLENCVDILVMGNFVVANDKKNLLDEREDSIHVDLHSARAVKS
jgi:carbamoyltransferase